MKQVVMKNLSEAFHMVKEMNLSSGDEWTGDYRDAARSAVAMVLRERMEAKVACHLARVGENDPDRRNGVYMRHVLTELGDITVAVPRTRRFSPKGVITAYARRTRVIDHRILTCFLLGLSTRKVGVALLSLLREKVSPQTVSRVGKVLDASVQAFHRRRIAGPFRALILDGIVMKRKTGAGMLARPVLVALGLKA